MAGVAALADDVLLRMELAPDSFELPSLPVRVQLTRDLSFPPIDSVCETDGPILRFIAPDTSFALVVNGEMIGYCAMIPGEAGYCQACLYIAPAGRRGCACRG